MEIPLLIITYIELEPKIEAKKKNSLPEAQQQSNTHTHTQRSKQQQQQQQLSGILVFYTVIKTARTHTQLERIESVMLDSLFLALFVGLVCVYRELCWCGCFMKIGNEKKTQITNVITKSNHKEKKIDDDDDRQTHPPRKWDPIKFVFLFFFVEKIK